MTCKVLLKLILLAVFAKYGTSEEYMCGFNEGLSNCKDFKNDVMKGEDLQLGKATVDGEDAMFLEGSINLENPIGDGYMFELEIAKETEMGSEPMFSCSMDLCKSIQDKDAPWAAAMQALGIEGCPIETGKYECANMTLDMAFLKDKMNPEFEGCYNVIMKMKDDKMNEVSCHKLGAVVKERDSRK